MSKPKKVAVSIIGIGGGGGNILNYLIENDLGGTDYIAINTDSNGLSNSQAKVKFKITPHDQIQRHDVMLKIKDFPEPKEFKPIQKALKKSGTIILVSCLGGFAGSVITPILARIARKNHIENYAVVTKPFSFESVQRKDAANKSIQTLLGGGCSVSIIKNSDYVKNANENDSLDDVLNIINSAITAQIYSYKI